MQISIWEKESFYSHKDYLIIGGGLMGLWTAYALQQQEPKASILILEKGVIPTGASTRNAGFACFGSPTELLHDIATMGEAKMWQVVEMRYKGIEKIRRVVGDAVVDYDACGGFECLSKKLHNIDALQDQLQFLNKGMRAITGDAESFGWANDKLTSFGFTGFDALVENKLEGGLHSGKLVQALTQKVQAAGVEILTGITVQGWEETGAHVVVKTAQGLSFSTRRMIICSNAFTQSLTPKLSVEPARGQVLVTAPIDGLQMRGTFHYDEGFYYFRNVGNRILIGGARNKAFDEERTTDMHTSDTITSELKAFVASHILQDKPFEIDYSWSGIMGFTENKEPVIERLSDKVIAVIACNGMGVALTPMMAEKIEF